MRSDVRRVSWRVSLLPYQRRREPTSRLHSDKPQICLTDLPWTWLSLALLQHQRHHTNQATPCGNGFSERGESLRSESWYYSRETAAPRLPVHEDRCATRARTSLRR